MKALLIIGLPASGKSHLIEKLKTEYKNTLFFDDEFCDIDNIFMNVVIAHPIFCIEEIRNKVVAKLINKGYDISYYYFENNPKQCLINAKNRDKKTAGYIIYLSKIYNPNCFCHPVFK